MYHSYIVKLYFTFPIFFFLSFRKEKKIAEKYVWNILD